MREAARIQSFPDSFVFPTKLRATERQIGNAVPPVLAWHIAQAVVRSIRGDGNHLMFFSGISPGRKSLNTVENHRRHER